MQNRETQQINEFELIDDHGNEYAIFEYQEGIQKPSLKRLKAGQSWFRLSDENSMSTKLTRIPSRSHRPTSSSIGRGNSYRHRDLKEKPQ